MALPAAGQPAPTFPGPTLLGDLTFTIEAGELLGLFDQARQGVRVHELMTLAHPVDLYRYLRLSAPLGTLSFLYQEGINPMDVRGTLSLTDGVNFQRFLEFTRHERTVDDWRRYLADGGFTGYLEELLGAVRQAQAELRASQDPLLAWEVGLIDAHAHPRDRALLEMGPQAFPVRRQVNIAPTYKEPLYDCLQALLALPSMGSFSNRGHADYRALRLACEERRRRGGLPAGDASVFPISVLERGSRWHRAMEHDPETGVRFALPHTPAWFQGIRWSSEGLGRGDLFLDDGGAAAGGAETYDLIEWWLKRMPGRVPLVLLSPDPIQRRHPRLTWFESPEGITPGTDHTFAATPEFQALAQRFELTPQPATDSTGQAPATHQISRYGVPLANRDDPIYLAGWIVGLRITAAPTPPGGSTPAPDRDSQASDEDRP